MKWPGSALCRPCIHWQCPWCVCVIMLQVQESSWVPRVCWNAPAAWRSASSCGEPAASSRYWVSDSTGDTHSTVPTPSPSCPHATHIRHLLTPPTLCHVRTQAIYIFQHVPTPPTPCHAYSDSIYTFQHVLTLPHTLPHPYTLCLLFSTGIDAPHTFSRPKWLLYIFLHVYFGYSHLPMPTVTLYFSI